MAATEYRSWVRDTQRCLVCDPWDTRAYRPDPHHIHRNQTRRTPEDYDVDNVVPLCFYHHNEFHNSGRYTWCEAYGLTWAGLEEIATDLYEHWARQESKCDSQS